MPKLGCGGGSFFLKLDGVVRLPRAPLVAWTTHTGCNTPIVKRRVVNLDHVEGFSAK
jgi:hypothetical protein